MSPRGTTTIGASFDARRNSLNALRLVLASMVIVRHASVLIWGTTTSTLWLDQIFGQFPVDGFFALSGFLIARSWLHRPRVRDFLPARIGRIYPGFWVCLVVTALVIRPISMLVGEPVVGPGAVIRDAAVYVARNATLVVTRNSVGATPAGVPWPGDWNGSLWTLKWEFLCYLGVMTLGLLGVLGSRRVIGGLWVLAWCLVFALTVTSLTHSHAIEALVRFFLMYMSGVFVYLFGDRLRVTRASAVTALSLAVVLAATVPNYRLLAALPLAYGLVGVGTTCYVHALRFENDVSYGMYIYGFPVEQLLAHSATIRGWGSPAMSVLALALTAGFAVLSWFLVEKPASRFFRSLATSRRRQLKAEPSP